MHYLSTREEGLPHRVGFTDVLLSGIAPDGGLYLPEDWPRAEEPQGSEYPEWVASTLDPYLEPEGPGEGLGDLTRSAYAAFRHPRVAPLRELGRGRFLLELFWGPTLSFKDHALQVVARLFDAELARRAERMVVLGATSGDTGSAAIAAFRGRANLAVVILYPEGKISEVQRRQMTTVADPNVLAVAVKGTFDDCQALVKRALVDRELGLRLAAVNSINWARIAVQASYYRWAARLVEGPVAFAVPTGNFGNVFAGYVAARMGSPISKLIVANNRNHGLTRLIREGLLEVEPVQATLAPAMDIQIPSNLERYLFELCGRNPDRMRDWREQLSTQGRLALAPDELAKAKATMGAGWLDDRQVLSVMGKVEAETGLLLDPHTAIAWEVGEQLRPPEASLVILATAHPAKFGEAVERATGQRPQLPPDLADLEEREERVVTIESDYPSLVRLLAGLSWQQSG
jgi:threonine synthase